MQKRWKSLFHIAKQNSRKVAEGKSQKEKNPLVILPEVRGRAYSTSCVDKQKFIRSFKVEQCSKCGNTGMFPVLFLL